MTTSTFVCWEATQASRAIRTEALEGSEALFNAIHTPMKDIEVTSQSELAIGERTSDLELLEKMSRDAIEHLFCVVRGAPGSGKSHLIRWLAINWKRDSDRVLLLNRAGGNLNQTLRQLRNDLGHDYDDLFRGLDQHTNISAEGQARNFLDRLANSTKKGYYERTEHRHEDWLEKKGVSEILKHPVVQGAWSAPDRILETLTGAGGERDSALAAFTMDDVRELADFGPKLPKEAFQSVHTFIFLKKLRREFKGYNSGDDLPENVRKLLEALNDRLRDAVRELLGFGSEGMQEIFRRLRERLGKQGKRLVLLLEDITSTQGVDDQLLDAVTTKRTAAGNESLCPLISIVGITPAYYDDHLQAGNMRDRIGLHLSLGQNGTDEGPGPVLATQASQLEFVARYLRAIRANSSTLERWHEGGRHGAPPNACTACELKQTCFESFGSHVLSDGEGESPIGFFPFIPRSITHMYESLSDPDGRQASQTPRRMLQSVLGPSLLSPDDIASGNFPHARVETVFHPKELRTPGGRVRTRLGAIAPHDSGLYERLRRLVVWWGGREDNGSEKPGFRGVPQGVFERFSLPFPGSSGNESFVVRDPIPKDSVSKESSIEVSVSTVTERATASPKKREPKSPRKAEGSRNRPRIKLKPDHLQSAVNELQSWVKDEQLLGDLDKWRRQFHRTLESLNWKRLGVSDWTREKAFGSPDMLFVEGARGASRGSPFVIPKAAWVADGMEAFLRLMDDPDLDLEDRSFHTRRYAYYNRRMSRLVREYAMHVAPPMADGTRWRPEVTFAQALVVRAWLRGVTTPSAPLDEQWSRALDRNLDMPSGAQERVPSWKETLKELQTTNRYIQDDLAAWVGLPQGTKKTTKKGLIEMSEIGPALVRLVDERSLGALPKGSEVSGLDSKYNMLRRIYQWGVGAERHLPHLAEREFQRIQRDVESVERLTGGVSIAEYVRRARGVVIDVQQRLPDVLTDQTRFVSSLFVELEGLGCVLGEPVGDDAVINRVEEFVVSRLEGDALVEEGILDLFGEEPTEEELKEVEDLLTQCIEAPVSDLKKVREALDKLDSLVETLAMRLRSYLNEHGVLGTSAISEVHEFGRAIGAHAGVLNEHVEVNDGS